MHPTARSAEIDDVFYLFIELIIHRWLEQSWIDIHMMID